MTQKPGWLGRFNKVLFTFLASGVLLAACNGAAAPGVTPENAPGPEQIEPTDPPPATDEAQKQLDSTSPGEAVTQPTAAPTEEIPPTVDLVITETEAPAPVAVRTELEASDPAQFALANGEYQFVEFFAFW